MEVFRAKQGGWPQLGFGLWNNAVATYALEAVLLLAGLWLYLRSTVATGALGKYGMGAFVILMLLINFQNLFGPPMGDDQFGIAITALVSYFLFAAIAFWLKRKRI